MPTPRPIMTPRIVAKSGRVSRLETRPTRMVPMPMPARATPTGKAHGEDRAEGDDQDHDGEGEAEDLGLRLLELGERGAPDLDLEALDVGCGGLDVLGDGERLVEGGVVRRLELGVGDLAGVVPARRDLEGAGLAVGADHGEVVPSVEALEHRLHGGPHLGVVDPLLGPEDDGPADARPLAAELGIEDVEARAALHVGERELVLEAGADRP
jgi:hypothetical protein